MKKRLMFMFLVSSLAIAISGCIQLEMEVSLNTDDTGDFCHKVLVAEEFGEELEEKIEGDLPHGTKREKISETINGQKYVGEKICGSFSSLGQLETFFDENIEITEKNGITTLIARTDDEVDQEIKMMGISSVFKVKVPGKIIETNGDVGKDNTVTWDMLGEKVALSRTAYVKYDKSATSTTTSQTPTTKKENLSNIKVVSNQSFLKSFEGKVTVEENKIIIPIENSSGNLEVLLSWNEKTKELMTSSPKGIVLSVKLNDEYINVFKNGKLEKIKINLPIQDANNITIIPMEKIAEILELTGKWSSDSFLGLIR